MRNLLLLLRIIIITDLAPLIATSYTVRHEVIVWWKVSVLFTFIEHYNIQPVNVYQSQTIQCHPRCYAV